MTEAPHAPQADDTAAAAPASGSVRLRYAARSDVGLRRPGNEDSGFADNTMLIVADGMGGHAAGELASAMAVATFAEMSDEDVAVDEVLEYLAAGVDLLSERIGDVIAAEPRNQGMGTTLTGLAWMGDRMAVVHVGDSRAYLLRDGRLSQITKDHTYVQSLVDAGEITAEEATRHPRRNLLNRAVDGIHSVEADLSMRETRAGDRYLLCTDGLSGVVGDDKLAEVLRTDSDPTGAVAHLVELALEGGAPDNVTVVVADIRASDDAAGAEPVVVGAAGEPQNRAKLPNVPWPVDEQLDPDDPQPRGARPSLDSLAPDPTSDPDSPQALAEAAPHRRTRRVVLAVVGVFILLLAAMGALLAGWLTNQWYVAASNGQVAVYRGVPGSLGPIPLQRLSEESDVAVTSLPSYSQTRVESGIPTSSMERADQVVAELRADAAACRVNPAEPGCPELPKQPNTPKAKQSDPTPAPSGIGP